MANAIQVKKESTPTRTFLDPFTAMRQEMDRMFDRFAVGFPTLRSNIEQYWPSAGNEFAMPVVDVSEDDKAYTISAELPGLESKDVSVTVNHEYVLIKGEKRQETEEKDKDHYLSERTFGAFQRKFALPADVDSKAVTAEVAKGVLKVTLPKSPESKNTRKVEVKAA